MGIYLEQTWWRKNRRKVLVLSAVVLLVVAGVVTWVWQSRWCAAGIQRVAETGECVGLSDGSFEFHPDLSGVLAKIEEENKRVEAAGNYVSIAYLAPMTLTGEDTITTEATRNGLQGAYLAQVRANDPVLRGQPGSRKTGWGGDFPLIRLLPTNPGSQFQQWAPVVEQIKAARSTPDRVVAVAGLGQSHEGTRSAVRELSAAGIPMVGATITADAFTEDESAGRFSGLVRVAPSNTEQVEAVVQQRLNGSRRAMLVQDENQSDLLATDLASAFNEVYPRTGGQLLRPETYNTELGSSANAFDPIVRNICVAKPDVLFFSGRYRDLSTLLNVLAERRCPDVELRVLTLDSVVDIAGVDEIRSNLSPGTTVEYTHLSSPAAWDVAPWAFDRSVVEYFRSGYFREFQDDSAGDGMATTSFDAVGVAVTAIQRAAGTTHDVDVVTPKSVTSQFHRMHGTDQLAGASGFLSFDCVGHPEDKPISVFSLEAGDPRPTSEIRPEVVSASGRIRTDPKDAESYVPTPRCR
ncbi:ABC transporter substrate-binding protein [Saccharopolyspora hirsuta]|uniref:ABC transporter substrate-binding protein n=1 Tax=Saccharopolyspora hirsuta TaxID=1837 RepID=A0A5M7C9Y6_SACHI|nr:ABC transporter substrate-binding protein [Saccharopolyspora hirsuta]KAA5838210.1 ABC transporter substrate-binding protein [Saccharopolyspora hirsuta]